MPLSTYRVLVTGSRSWPRSHVDWVNMALESAAEDARYAGAGLLVVVHGGAAGADTMAHDWTVKNPLGGGWLPVVEEVHRPAWNSFRGGAGHRRNAQMVSQGADVCLPFIKDNSPGATGCLERAIAAGIPAPYVWRL
jgi:hypothetical protein